MSGRERRDVRARATGLAVVAAVALGGVSAVPEARAGAGSDPTDGVVTGLVDRPTHVAAHGRSTWTGARMLAAVANASGRELRRGRQGSRRRPRWTTANPAAQLVGSDLPGMRVIGRLFFKRPDGLDSACSGTLVESANKSVVWTAGHCVDLGRSGGPYRDFAFVPAYRPASVGGPAPYGVWPTVRWATTRAWARTGDKRHIRRDVGGVVLGRDVQGRTVTDVLGAAQRIGFGRRPGRVASLGFPGLPPFNGESLFQCGPNPTGPVSGFLGRGRLPSGVACAQTAGASGGPWLASVDGGSGIGTVVSVTSVKANGVPWLVGPVLDREARKVYQELSTAPN